jgi:hypothetical protein|uniref:Uncharacterized protein n=1 Tax=Siphoviridae sp. ctvxh7 TaxID=2827283 RepID=A0A8S5RA89_9CAUD|nr:MAG TPA: hypothetical protein [Siphoviridae sp. ctvxh7]
MTITIADGRASLWQWDTGRRVKITDGVGVKQIHYQKRCFGRSVDVDVGDDGTAIIPDELLQDYHTLTAYAYVTDDAGGYTKVQQDFAVYKRPKPADYVYTPTEHASFDRLRAEIGDLDDLTTADKSTIVAAINEAAASGGGGADWAQNDPDGDGYVANRPGGYMTDPVITDADTFTITSAEGEDGMYMTMVAVESSVVTLSDYAIGNDVIVDFGGQSYSLTWQSEGGYPACGAAVTDEGPVWSSVPFHIIAVFGEGGGLQGYYVYLQNAVTSPVQVKLKMAKQTPVKISMKYLESDVYIVKVTSKSNEQRPGLGDAEVSYDVTVSATYDDIVAAINAGKVPILLGEPVLSEPVLRLVNHSTDDVDGSTPFLTFGGAYFHQQNRLYGTCVYIDSTGEATCRVYDGSFVRRFEAFEEASSQSVGKVLVGKKYSDYKYMWAAGDAVLCDEQTLTDAQKKQARDNIDATSSDFVINATLDDDNKCTVDKTYAQIQEAVQANKKPVVHLDQGGTTVFMPLVASGGYFAFAGSILINPPMSAQFVVSIQDNNEVVFDMSYGLGLGHDNALPQVRMSKDPREAMEIATKQYVDDHASGGTGMGITGAAAGQIAKITAVDKSGVPTAWGPVDMPAGVPSVTAADNGKFLRVVNGAWAAAEISSANGVSF